MAHGPEGVRSYRDDDREAVLRLWRQSGIARHGNDLGAELDRHPHPGLLLVAAGPGGEVVGAVMGAWDGRRGWIYHLAVAAAWRRQGRGRALLASVEDRLRAMSVPKVQLLIDADNGSVAGFYARRGYAPEDVRFLSKRLDGAPPASPRRVAPGGGVPATAAGVRSYVTQDRAAVVDLWQRTGIARPWNDLGAELDRHPHPHLRLVAAGPGGEVVGAVLGAWDGRRGWIYHLAVAAAWRRRGAGGALLAEVEGRLAVLGTPKVNLLVRGDNLGVLAFYARGGYRAGDVCFMSKWLQAAPGMAR